MKNKSKKGKMVKCDFCGKEFYRCLSALVRSKHFFCSQKCRNMWMLGKNKGKDNPNWNSITTHCDFCSKELYRRLSSLKHFKHIFCDIDCKARWMATQKPWNEHKKLSKMHVQHLSESHMGQKSWNDGLTKETDERVATYTASRQETLNKLKETDWLENRNKKIAETLHRKFKSGEIVSASKGVSPPNERKKRISETLKKKYASGEIVSPMRNPAYVKKSIQSNGVKPNKPERKLQAILNEVCPNEYKYVGDGEFILAGKCPDFMNVNGQKKLIEHYGTYWHRNDNPQDRIDLFKQYGYDTLIIQEVELEDKNIDFLNKKLVAFNKKEF